MTASDLLVFDTGPLSHFARENWLGVLKAVVGGRSAVIPDVVAEELRVGAASDTRIGAVLAAEWIEHRVLDSAQELAAFARFSSVLVRGERNRGEAGVLALAHCAGGVAVVDDGPARRAAQDAEVALRPTLALLCEAIRGELLTVPLVSALADDLMIGEYRLPFGPGGFEKWALENGLVA